MSKKQSLMNKCMSEWTKKHPKGRSNTPMTKKQAHKQAVAACLNKVEESEMKIKDLIEGMTFKYFLITEASLEDPNTVRGFIRRQPMYQELLKDPQTKPEVLKFARSVMQELGDGPIGPKEQSYILDMLDDIYTQHSPGINVGDWEGEAEYQQRAAKEKELEKTMDKWEKTVGTNAETGEDLPVARRGGPGNRYPSRRVSGARPGMEFQADKKAAQAKRDLAAFANASDEDRQNRLVQAQSRASEVKTPRKGTKITAARQIFNSMYGEERPSTIIRQMMNEIGLSKPHATTYYYKFKKEAS